MFLLFKGFRVIAYKRKRCKMLGHVVFVIHVPVIQTKDCQAVYDTSMFFVLRC